MKGYNYAKGEESLEKMIFCTEMLIISEVALESYDKEKDEFTKALKDLSEKKRKQIYDVVRWKNNDLNKQIRWNRIQENQMRL